MRRAVTAIVALCCLSAPYAHAADQLVSFDSAACQRYRYDLAESDVSAVELSEIMELVGPIWTVRTRWLPHLTLCIDGDPAYRPCGSRKPSSPNFRHNAAVNLAPGPTLISRIEALRNSLERLKLYYAFQYSFWLELAIRQLDYLHLRDPALLSAPLMGLDVAQSCGSQAVELMTIDADDDTVLDSFKDWHNCVNQLMHDSPTQAAGYPKAAWGAFLEAESIREQITPVLDCEQEW